MSCDDVTRKELLALLKGGHAHMGLDRAIAEFPVDEMNATMPGINYKPWHVLEHIRIAQWDIVEFIRNPDHVSPDWPDDYWPDKDANAGEAEWRKIVAQIKADRAILIEMVEDPKSDLYAPLPGGDEYNIVREILTVADHMAYHIGEFVLMGNLLGASDEK